MLYLEEIALKETKKVENKLAEEGFNHIATLTLAYQMQLYRVKEDPQRIFGLCLIVDDKEVKEIFENGDVQYKATSKQIRGDKTFKIYRGGQKNDK